MISSKSFVVLLILVFAMGVMLFGCAPTEETEEAPTDDPDTDEEPDEDNHTVRYVVLAALLLGIFNLVAANLSDEEAEQ